MGEVEEKRNFAQHLWDGFERCFDLSTAGRHDLKSLQDFLRKRSEIERSYGTNLKQHVQKAENYEVEGSVRVALDEFKTVTESIANHHIQLADKLNDYQRTDLEELIRNMKDVKTKHQQQHTRLVADCNKKTTNHKKAHDIYGSAHKKQKAEIDNRNTGLSKSLPQKKQDKLEKSLIAATGSLDQAHSHYRESVNELKKSQEEYDAKNANMLESFEQLERKRISTICSTMEWLTTIHDMAKSNLEQSTLLMGDATKKISVETDVQNFITKHFTTKQPDPHVEYKQLDQQDTNPPGTGGGMTTTISNGPVAAGGPAEAESKAAPPPGGMNPSQSSIAGGPPGGAPPGARIGAPPGGAPPGGPRMGTGGGGPPGGAPPGRRAPPPRPPQRKEKTQFVRALYDTEPEEGQNEIEPEELGLKAGDIVKLIEDLGNGWWSGEMQDGSKGILPFNYVQVIECDDPNPSWDYIIKIGRKRCTALYDFPGKQEDGELSFTAGEELTIVSELEDWYTGNTDDGRSGIFPANYVQLMT